MEDVIRSGLLAAPRRLPSALLYDALGSTLFEAITMLPEYEVSRAGLRLLRAHGEAIVALPAGPVDIVELGPGSGKKARLLVEALRRRQPRVRFAGVDVSAQALEACRQTLEDVPGVDVEVVEANFIEGLERVLGRRPGGPRVLVLFLGSSLSNFDRPDALQFLRDVRSALRVDDALLLATDLDKDQQRLLAAYDDALGVTAAFNKNVLVRLNREWGADFQVDLFSHVVRWSEEDRRIEMHLLAERRMEVTIPRLELRVRLEAGETIWTESSYRFSIEEIGRWAEQAGFRVRRQWVDAAWPFAQTLLEARHG